MLPKGLIITLPSFPKDSYVSSKTIASRYCPLWAFPFRASLQDFKMRMIGRDYHAFIRNALFPSPTDLGSNNPPPWGPNVLAGTPPDDWL